MDFDDLNVLSSLLGVADERSFMPAARSGAITPPTCGGKTLPAGHVLPEEVPEETLRVRLEFL